MAYQKVQNLSGYISLHLLLLQSFVLVSTLVLLLNPPYVRGRSPESFKSEGSSTQGNGDVVDCVDVYKQPAFNHPLMKNHKIEIAASLYPSNMNGSNSAPDLIQPWHKIGMCSEGTVPIRRRKLQETSSNVSTNGPHHELATLIAIPTETRFYGVGGEISVWNPAVSRTEDYSASAVIVRLREGAYFMAGWIVYPELYRDFQTRFFIFWKTDTSTNTGCYDLHCEGFVQVNQNFVLGSRMSSVSTIGAETHRELRIIIFRSRDTGNWWLRVGGDNIGYWPATLFGSTSEGAENIQWGGQILDSVGGGQHTATDMGNGLFPDIGTYHASSVCRLQYVDSSFTLRTPTRSTLGFDVTNPLCYDAELLPNLDPDNGLCFLFGGSGRNARCP
ncbi:hypothetical protein BVRB_9g211750 [Beta vulgaris subsp. vulgaris]|nr:hypothetical protein BVRB_9g211750 [Beta vulgaris subsp. vulgaris]